MNDTHTIGQQVQRGFLAALAIALVLAIAATAALVQISRAQNDVVDRGLRLLILAGELRNATSERAVAVRDFLVIQDEEFATEVEDWTEEISRLAGEMDERVEAERAEALLSELRELDAIHYEEAVEAMAARRAGLRGEELANTVRRGLHASLVALSGTLDELVAFEQSKVNEGVADVRRRRNLALVVFGVLAVTAIGLNLVLTRRITGRTTAALTEVTLAIDGATSDMLTSNSQQVSGASQQAASIQETVTTVDELAQSADETTRRARAVVAKTEESSRTAEDGSAAVNEATDGMAAVREQVNTIAETILSLARQAQSISGIIDTVDDIAEQTNLLALNAAIEAARAGEQGRGFSVVAAEIRDLADQSKRATGEVASILGEIQDATNKAVMATEEGTEGATSGMQLVSRAGTTISELAQTIEEATVAADQIAAAAEQQAGATGQISVAMNDIRDVMEQNLGVARQSEQTAKDLSGVAERLKALVGTT